MEEETPKTGPASIILTDEQTLAARQSGQGGKGDLLSFHRGL